MKSFIVLLLSAFIGNAVTYEPWDSTTNKTTTPDIEFIVKGRCAEYQLLDSKSIIPELRVDVNCNKLWEEFKKPWANKTICDMSENAYDNLVDFMDNKESFTNKTLFWSGTKEVSHDFTHVNDNFFTVEDTFPGYVADGLSWCGCTNCSDGITYDKSCNCSLNYWDEASRNFAMKAKGIVSNLVNGTQVGFRTAYYEGTVFGRIELPTLAEQFKKGIVKQLNVYVISTLDEKPKESCGTGTLVKLVKDAKKYGLTKINCYDEPTMVLDILCAKYPHANECQEIDRKVTKIESWKDGAIALIAVSGVLLVIVIVLLVMYNRRSKANSNNGYTRDPNV